MPEEDFHTPTDADALRRAELLAFEVRFLKARLAETERAPTDLQNRLEEAERTIAQLTGRVTITPRRKARLESAERDLITLLTRLSKSPLGKVLRLKKGYRNLEQRYSKGR
ncbi:MAG: hypothetical protein WA990_10305 [Rubrobacteraceae bacterium]